ncbi:unnamed protein product [Acanthoscelides obtectus]|uniref:Uncharacterized protein n=1 Tax=Acanthoscelides obtectus TaxID=200917 RepID=A0A9P0JIC9_ACAOB|nr:unnamed protein product [Acanthoscelides obtectus]CAK1661472.1 hypothetical protein AOBTE_LOCUS22642 [Acanthoscelides obtectus]
MNFSMTPENIGDVYVKLDVIIAGQPKSKFPVMFNLTQFGYQNLRHLVRPSSPIRDSVCMVSCYNPFIVSRKPSLTYPIPYKNSFVNRARNAHTYATHPEKVRQLIKSKDAHVLCSYFTSKRYVDRVEQLIEQQKILLDDSQKGAKVTYEHVIDCAQPERSKIKREMESKSDEGEQEIDDEMSPAMFTNSAGRKKPVKTTVLSLMLKKKQEDTKKSPILNQAGAIEGPVLRHRTTILPLILKNTKRIKQREKKFAETDSIEMKSVRSTEEENVKESRRFQKVAEAYPTHSVKQARPLERPEKPSSRGGFPSFLLGAVLSRSMTTLSVPMSRLKSTKTKNTMNRVTKNIPSSIDLYQSVRPKPLHTQAEDGASQKSLWSILSWPPFGSKQANKPTPLLSVNRVLNKTDAAVEEDEQSQKKISLKNAKQKGTASNVMANGTVLSKKSKRKSRVKVKKLRPPEGVATTPPRCYLFESEIDNINKLYDKVRSGPLAKKRRPQSLLKDRSLEELMFAAVNKLSKNCRRDAASILKSLLDSPCRATQIKRANCVPTMICQSNGHFQENTYFAVHTIDTPLLKRQF